MPLDPYFKRVTHINDRPIDPGGECVVYWMQRSQRVRDNPALNFAIDLANDLGKMIPVYFGVFDRYPMASTRAFKFMLEGLRETSLALRDIGAGFLVRREKPYEGVVDVAKRYRACAVVVDEDYLNVGRTWRAHAAVALPVRFIQVDAETVVPARLIGSEQWAAYTLRPKILRVLRDWLVEFPTPTINRRWTAKLEGLDLLQVEIDQLVSSLDVEHNVPPVPDRIGGETHAKRVLTEFVHYRLPYYLTLRDDLSTPVSSGLSPYLHFGQISSRRVALTVLKADVPREPVEAFLEQLVVRRELAINFCTYNTGYASLETAPRWARETLENHRSDPRLQVYTLDELEFAQTHDDVWNAAQMELFRCGIIHPYVRMFWAKKLLEWCPSPEQALSSAIYLNDKYALDGRDPNGYANIAWCIYGKHDRPFRERPIFGKVRYMSTDSLKRKSGWQNYTKRFTN
ncbi:MAG: deoxyribodipyrimidine photo-lyase [Armatimonadota bacterium]|nr:deoxyribodipyrimidine photo-lyase [Armatimonadota bacterium]